MAPPYSAMRRTLRYTVQINVRRLLVRLPPDTPPSSPPPTPPSSEPTDDESPERAPKRSRRRRRKQRQATEAKLPASTPPRREKSMAATVMQNGDGAIPEAETRKSRHACSQVSTDKAFTAGIRRVNNVVPEQGKVQTLSQSPQRPPAAEVITGRGQLEPDPLLASTTTYELAVAREGDPMLLEALCSSCAVHQQVGPDSTPASLILAQRCNTELVQSSSEPAQPPCDERPCTVHMQPILLQPEGETSPSTEDAQPFGPFQPHESNEPMPQEERPELEAHDVRLQQFANRVSTHIDDTQATPATPQPRSRRKLVPATSIRRSRRLATSGNRGTALDRAQSVLMRKLGLLSHQETISQEARDAYARLFEQPLSRTHLAAVASIFGWTVPAECEARSADLLSC